MDKYAQITEGWILLPIKNTFFLTIITKEFAE